MADKNLPAALGFHRLAACMIRPDDLDARPGWRSSSTGARAARRETIARKRAAGNERLQHTVGLGKTVGSRRQTQLMRPRFHVHEAAVGDGNGKSIDRENRIGTGNVELIVAIEGK